MSDLPQPHLRAALTVAALRSDERHWLTQQLSLVERARLDAALREIGGQPLGELMAELANPSETLVDETPRSRQWARRIPQLAETILREPAWTWPVLGAALGASIRWRVLQALTHLPDQAEQLAALRDAWQVCDLALAPEMRAAVLGQLRLMVDEEAGETPAAHLTPPGAPMWPLVRLWRKWRG